MYFVYHSQALGPSELSKLGLKSWSTLSIFTLIQTLESEVRTNVVQWPRVASHARVCGQSPSKVDIRLSQPEISRCRRANNIWTPGGKAANAVHFHRYNIWSKGKQIQSGFGDITRLFHKQISVTLGYNRSKHRCWSGQVSQVDISGGWYGPLQTKPRSLKALISQVICRDWS